MNVLTKIRISMLAAGLAMAAPAAAQDGSAHDAGWNTQYGMIFSLQNVFTQSGIIGSYDPDGVARGVGAGIGVQYNLSPTTGLRFSVALARQSDDAYVSERTVVTAGGTTTQKTFHAPNFTSDNDFDVGAMYMARLGAQALAPYVGAGVSLGYRSTALAYTNDLDPNAVVKVDNTDRTFDVGLGGRLGLEWRLHKSLSLFAEYGLEISALQMRSSDHQSTTAAATTTDKYSKTTFFNFNTGLTQGGQLGLVAFF